MKNPLLFASLTALALAATPAAGLDLDQLGKGKFKLGIDAQALYTMGGRKTTDQFSLKQMRLAFEGKHPAWLDFGYRIQYEAARSTISPYGLTDGYVEAARRDAVSDLIHLKLRLGQTRRPFSYESYVLGDREIELVNRSKVVEGLVPGRDVKALAGRDVGGFLEAEFAPELREKFLVGTVGVFNGEGSGGNDKNKQKDLDLRLAASPRSWISLGGSYTNGRLGQPTQVRDRKGAEIALNYGPFHLRSEYIYGRDHMTLREGWYVHGNYRIYKDKLMFSSRYEEFNPNKEDHRVPRQKQTTVGVNYWLLKELRLTAVLEMQRDSLKEDRGLFLVSLAL